MSIDFGSAAEDYAQHRAGFPDSFFQRLERMGVLRTGAVVVDVGTGTGTVARGFARRGAIVTGIDPDERLLTQARKLSEQEGVAVDYRLGAAEKIPHPRAFADTVTAGQCWHWFDPTRAASEFARIVKQGGQVVIAHFDWLPLPGNVVQATEQLIKQHNPQWNFDGGNGMHPESLPYLYAAGFRGFETFSYDLEVAYSPESWRGRIRASAGVASLDPERVRIFDGALADVLASHFPGELLPVPHRVYAAIGVRR